MASAVFRALRDSRISSASRLRFSIRANLKTLGQAQSRSSGGDRLYTSNFPDRQYDTPAGRWAYSSKVTEFRHAPQQAHAPCEFVRGDQLIELGAHAHPRRFVFADDEEHYVAQPALADERRRADEYVLTFDRTKIADCADE